jgi:quercetin dioxygenase-like cupin family protein
LDDLAGLELLAVWDGIHARTIEGERCAFAVVELDPGAVVPEHSHEHEQLGTWRIPPNAPHEVHAGPEGAVVVDVFAPARDDWQDLERLEPRPPRWP